MAHTYTYPRAALTVDCVVFGIESEGLRAFDALRVLLIQRAHPPFAGSWALPGGFLDIEETSEEAARRELLEETGLRIAFLEQLYTFSRVDRDPRERVISIAYFALVQPSEVSGGSDAAEAAWVPLHELPELAFDHAEIIELALERLRTKIRYQPIGFELLPRKFTLGQLQRLYETILDRPLDKRNFRRSMLRMGILQDLDELEQGVPHRPSRLFRFDRGAYRRLLRSGFSFEV